MNSKFLKVVAFRALILWPALYVAISNAYGLGLYAEQFISFFGVLMLVIGLITVFACKHLAKQGGAKEKYAKSKAHLAFTTIAIIIETCIFAALGWYWVASGFMLVAISSAMVRAEIEKLEVV